MRCVRYGDELAPNKIRCVEITRDCEELRFNALAECNVLINDRHLRGKSSHVSYVTLHPRSFYLDAS